jgi:hypothetical protein
MMTHKTMLRLAAVGTAVGVLLGGCSEYNDKRGKGDAPVEDREGDDKPAVVVNFPDGFANVALKCYGGTGFVSTTREAPVQVVPDARWCDGDAVSTEVLPK